MHYSLCEQQSAEYCADPLNLQSEINTVNRNLPSTVQIHWICRVR